MEPRPTRGRKGDGETDSEREEESIREKTRGKRRRRNSARGEEGERESEMVRECYEKERKETDERQGGAKGGIVGERRTERTRDGRQGRGRAETLKRFETGSRTVAHFDPSLGGWMENELQYTR